MPVHLPRQVILKSGEPGSLVREAQSLGYRRIYIDGGGLIQSFLRNGLISDMTITTVPVLLGRGRSLFGTSTAEVQLRLQSSRAYPFGLVQSVYEVRPRC